MGQSNTILLHTELLQLTNIFYKVAWNLWFDIADFHYNYILE